MPGVPFLHPKLSGSCALLTVLRLRIHCALSPCSLKIRNREEGAGQRSKINRDVS